MRGSFFLKRAIVSFVRNKYNNMSSIINVAVITFFSILILFIVENVIEFIDRLFSESSAVIIMRDSANENDIEQVKRLMADQKVISNYKSISPEDALKEIKDVFSISEDIADIEPSRLLPYVFELKFSRSMEKQYYEGLLNKLRQIPSFGEIRVNQELLELSFKVRRYSIYFKGIILFIVFISSFYILSSTIGLNLNNNRREEIELIELLGGDAMDIKIPFVLEGILLVSIGFLIGSSFTYLGLYLINPYIGKIIKSHIFSFQPLIFSRKDLMLIYAVLLFSGIIGVLKFINRFIKGLYEQEN